MACLSSYSTCLGRVKGAYPKAYGTHQLTSPTIHGADVEGLLAKGAVRVAPNGVAFVKASERPSLLASLLTDLLAARQRVKREMAHCDDLATKRMLDARQLALKYIANVTYGYTAASFSGRMPLVELADAIVSTGRSILERVSRYEFDCFSRLQ